jgi:hypothetical protein
MRMLLLIVILCGNFFSAGAQGFAWWERVVNWDGITPWERYIKFTPGYMGPNALPVPPIGNGTIDSITSMGFGAQFHFSKEDKTQNISLYANYSLVKNKISFDLYWVPVEHFKMSHRLKEERHVFADNYYDKYATGDIHLSTNIQLFNNKRNGWASALRVGYRFPSSNGLGAARFTDAPGYWLDVSFGKTFNNNPSLKWITTLGGYFWQADNIDRHRQDDALLVGTGLELNKKRFRLQTYIGGYFGYFEQKRDDPMVARVNAEKTFGKKVIFMKLQQGLNDFKYSSVEVGVKYQLSKNL